MAAMVRPTILQLIIIWGLITLIWSGFKLVGGQISQVSPKPQLLPVSPKPLPALTPLPSSVATPTSSLQPLTAASPRPSPTKLPNPQLEINQFRYPNSSQVSAAGNSLNLESSDNADTITNWYEKKIASLGMSAKSFVKTRTNGKVLNKLVASGNRGEIEVEISQLDASSQVTIVVTIKYWQSDQALLLYANLKNCLNGGGFFKQSPCLIH